ncbi:MAG: sodium:solute symporter family protein [Candidatus Hadarchaeum sp.]
MYGVILIALGLYSYIKAKNRHTEEEYFLASRELGFWALVCTVGASWTGISALISYNAAYTGGVSTWWIMGFPTVFATAVVAVLAYRIRKTNAISQPQIFEWRYGPKVRIILAVIGIWYMMTWAASELIGGGESLSVALGMPYFLGILAITLIVYFYTVIGGFRAVIYTDIFQFILLNVVCIALSLIALSSIGGFGAIALLPQELGVPGYLDFFDNFRYNFAYAISFSLAWFLEADMWQRILGARNPKLAMKAFLVAAILFIPLYFIYTLGGMAAAKLVPGLDGVGVLPSLAQAVFPPILFGFALAGILATVMSSADTAINSGALLLTEDVYHRYINKKATTKGLFVVGLIATTIITILAFGVGITLPDMLWVLWLGADILACGCLAPLMGGVIWTRANELGAIAGMIVGGVFAFYNYVGDLFGIEVPRPWPEYPFYLPVGILLSAIAFILVSLATKPQPEKFKALKPSD